MNKIYGITGLLLFICVFTALKNPAFLEPYNLQNNLRWIALFGILAIGVAFVIMTGGIDLSIGSVVGLTGCILAMALTEDITRQNSYEVLATSANNKTIRAVAESSGLSPGRDYLYAGTVHRLENVKASDDVVDKDESPPATSLLTIDTAPKENAAGHVVLVHGVSSIDRITSTVTLQGEHANLIAQDQIGLVITEQGKDTKVATYTIASTLIDSGQTKITVDDDLRRMAPSDWKQINASRHAMLLKRSAPMSVFWAILLVLAVSIGIGMYHGVSITKFGMQPFIVTLCGLLFYRGIARWLTDDQTQGFGTGYQDLKYLANGKPFSMAFVILLSGAMLAIWYAFKTMVAKRRGESNLTPHRMGLIIGLAIAFIGSSRYLFSYTSFGNRAISSQYWVSEGTVKKVAEKFEIGAIGDLNTVKEGDVVFYSQSNSPDIHPVTVEKTWIFRDPADTTADPITYITVNTDPAQGAAVNYSEDAWPILTMGYRVTFVESDINEITITGDHPELIRGDALTVQSGAASGLGAGSEMIVKTARPTRDHSQTIVVVDAVPSDIDLSSAITISMRNPRPQKIPGYLLLTFGAVLLAIGLAKLGKLFTDMNVEWAAARTPLTFTIGGASALLIGLTPIPLILVPMPFVIMVLFAMAAGIFVNQTIYGRYILALGRNEQAARYSGINTDRMIILSYVLCSLAAGVGGILFALDLNSIGPSGHGNFYELFAIAGAVLGGCSLRGGEGQILGVVIGVAVMRVLLNAINILGIPTQLEYAIIGAVIFLGVLVDEMVKRWAAKRRAAREAKLAMEG